MSSHTPNSRTNKQHHFLPMVPLMLTPSSLSSTVTVANNEMSQWMTSGASRLRSKQNGGSFASRAKAASAASTSAISRSASVRMPSKRQGGRRLRMASGETITRRTSKPSRSQHRAGVYMNNGVPPSVASRTVAVGGMSRKSLDYLPSSVTGAMPASRNPFRSSSSTNSLRPSNDNPFEAAMQAVEETRSRRQQVMPSTLPPFSSSRTSQQHHASPLTPASLSLKGDKIMRLLAANQNGSLASPSSISQMSQMTSAKNPFSLPVSRNGLRLPSRGIKLPPRRTNMEQEQSNEFMLDAPTGVDVPSSLVARRNRNALNVTTSERPLPSRGVKRGSDESSFSSDSSCGSRKQARRLNAMHVSDTRGDGSAIGATSLRRSGGLDRFRNRHSSDENQASPVASQPVPSVIKTTVPNRSAEAPALRFFNNGVEVDINGKPLSPPEPEPVDLDTLKDHQKSVWDQFIETPEEMEARKRKSKYRAKRYTKSKTAVEEEGPKPLDLKVDPTPSALSADPSKLASADVDALVRDSLKEREKTLSAASVLMGFLGGNAGKSDSVNM